MAVLVVTVAVASAELVGTGSARLQKTRATPFSWLPEGCFSDRGLPWVVLFTGSSVVLLMNVSVAEVCGPSTCCLEFNCTLRNVVERRWPKLVRPFAF